MIGINNPFNIRVNKSNPWLGTSGARKGFVSFKELKFGIRAAAILILRTYRKKDVLTISEIINRFAPSSENDTDSYINFVCSRLSCFPFDIPSYSEYPALLSAMSIYEGNPVGKKVIEAVLDEFKIVPYKRK